MKAWKATITNEPSTTDGGSVYQNVIVFADDIVGATMDSQAALESLQQALKSAHCPTLAWSTLSIASIEHLCDVVDGRGLVLRVGGEEEGVGDVKEWARRIAKRTKLDMDT